MSARITDSRLFLDLLRQTDAWDELIIALICTAVSPSLDRVPIAHDERCDRPVRVLHKASADHIAAIPDAITYLRVGVQQNTSSLETAASEDANVERNAPLPAIQCPYNDFGCPISTGR